MYTFIRVSSLTFGLTNYFINSLIYSSIYLTNINE